MNLSAKNIDDLKEFVRLVRKLESSTFSKRLLSAQNISYQHSVESGNQGMILNFDEEECESFLLSCRLLMQNNERTSIQRVWALFHDNMRDHPSFVRINPARWKLNDYLDRVPAIPLIDRAHSSGLILNTFLYGAYAHRNREKCQLLSEWEQDAQTFSMYKMTFLLALKVMLDCAKSLAAGVVEFLEKSGHAIP